MICLCSSIVYSQDDGVEIPVPIYNISTNDLKVNQVKGNDLIPKVIKAGDTDSFLDGCEFVVSSNSVHRLIFPDTSIKIEEGSSVSLVNGQIIHLNKTSPPARAMLSERIMSFTVLDGSIDIVSLGVKAPLMVHTPRVTVLVKRANCRIIVQGKTTIVAVESGEVLLNKVVEGDKLPVKSGAYAHVTTYVSLSNKGMDTINNGRPTATIKEISQSEQLNLKESIIQLSKDYDSVFFATIRGEVIGIKK